MISLNWVKDYVDLEGVDLNELALKVTEKGINVEGVYSHHIDNLVIGEIVDVKNHPDSDHLHVCMVNTGKDVLQIVCGAPNVRKGLKIILSLPGAILPGNVEIKKSVIRGVESNGMICALFELGLEERNEENYAKGIAELPDDAPVGKDPLEYLGLDDTVYDLDIHKHRNNDCYYHIGFAYEVGTVIDKKVKLPEISYKEEKDSIEGKIELKVDTKKCPLYYGKLVTNVKIAESPEWIKKRIISAGMRPINNVVDISNFVMLEFGQPTHFFDADKMGSTILVRDAKDGEKITTLDKVERVLTKDDIVITDGSIPGCIAGVMGGENVEVDDNTKNIFIESAIFDSLSIRNTAARLDLKSEASIRYGKGLSYEYTKMAMDRCCELLQKYAGGKVLSGTLVHDKVDKSPKIIKFSHKDINALLGIEISKEDMIHELERLQFPYDLNKDIFTVTVPPRRLDIESNVADMAEEIGRLYGYQNLKNTLPLVPTKQGEYKEDIAMRKAISYRLRSLGINEVKTYTLVSPLMAQMFNYDEDVHLELPNPMSADKSVIRSTIIPSLLNVYDYNNARKINNIFVYECAQTYNINKVRNDKVAILMKGSYLVNKAQNINVKADFYVLKGIIENLLKYLGLKNRYDFVKADIDGLHPGVSAKILVDRIPVGIIGRVHPKLYKDDIYVCELSISKLFELNTKPLKFKEASKYPEIKKDVAFIVNNEVINKDIIDVIRKSGGRLLSDIEIFDIFQGVEDNKKSMAYSLTFKDPTRTLSDDEVMEVFNKIIKDVTTKLDATLRDK